MLKVASVIGRRFQVRALQDTFPIVNDRPNVRTYVGEGLRSTLIEVDISEPHVSYMFQHVITQQVAYKLLLVDQRKQLHRSVAEWHERVEWEQRPPAPACWRFTGNRPANQTRPLATSNRLEDCRCETVLIPKPSSSLKTQ